MLESRKSVTLMVVTVISFAFIVLKAEERKVDMIVPIQPPSKRPVTISTGVMSLADGLKKLSAESGIAISARGATSEFLARKVSFGGGALPLWQRLDEICAAVNCSFETHVQDVLAFPSRGDVIGHAVVGPTLLVLRALRAKDNSGLDLQLAAYYHPWEVAHDADTPTITGVVARVPGIAPIAASAGRVRGSRDRALWAIAPRNDVTSGIPAAKSIDGTLSVMVRSSLYQLTMPFGKNSTASTEGLSARSVKVDHPSSTDTSETFELSWRSGLTPREEALLSAIHDKAAAGQRPSDDDLKWAQQKLQHARMFTIAEVYVVGSNGSIATPKAYLYRSPGLSRLDVDVRDRRETLANARVEIIVGIERLQKFRFSVPVR